ncbi:hypothetical protein KY316_03425 [Candidatus Woesearchaeota archaeon]|nr:hypothetical protein [Candidatus Woesearchaeota archaeon]
MAKLYKDNWYPGQKTEVAKTVVEVMTSEEDCSLRMPDGEGLKKVAINYGSMRHPPIRAVQWEDKQYNIDAESKTITQRPVMPRLFYDADKIELSRQFIVEGTIDDILEEFEKAGFEFLI